MLSNSKTHCPLRKIAHLLIIKPGNLYLAMKQDSNNYLYFDVCYPSSVTIDDEVTVGRIFHMATSVGHLTKDQIDYMHDQFRDHPLTTRLKVPPTAHSLTYGYTPGKAADEPHARPQPSKKSASRRKVIYGDGIAAGSPRASKRTPPTLSANGQIRQVVQFFGTWGSQDGRPWFHQSGEEEAVFLTGSPRSPKHPTSPLAHTGDYDTPQKTYPRTPKPGRVKRRIFDEKEAEDTTGPSTTHATSAQSTSRKLVRAAFLLVKPNDILIASQWEVEKPLAPTEAELYEGSLHIWSRKTTAHEASYEHCWGEGLATKYQAVLMNTRSMNSAGALEAAIIEILQAATTTPPMSKANQQAFCQYILGEIESDSSHLFCQYEAESMPPLDNPSSPPFSASSAKARLPDGSIPNPLYKGFPAHPAAPMAPPEVSSAAPLAAATRQRPSYIFWGRVSPVAAQADSAASPST